MLSLTASLSAQPHIRLAGYGHPITIAKIRTSCRNQDKRKMKRKKSPKWKSRTLVTWGSRSVECANIAGSENFLLKTESFWNWKFDTWKFCSLRSQVRENAFKRHYQKIVFFWEGKYKNANSHVIHTTPRYSRKWQYQHLRLPSDNASPHSSLSQEHHSRVNHAHLEITLWWKKNYTNLYMVMNNDPDS